MSQEGWRVQTRIAACSTDPIRALGLKVALDGTKYSLVGVLTEPSRFADFLSRSLPGILIWECAAEDRTLFQVLRQIRAALPDCSVIGWMPRPTHGYARELLNLGIRAILPVGAPVQVVRECLDKVSTGGVWLEPELEAFLAELGRPRLSRREVQLVHLVAGGLTNKEIAAKLCIAEGTVKVYLSKLFRKLNVTTRLDLAMYGVRNYGASLAERASAPAVAPYQTMAAAAG